MIHDDWSDLAAERLDRIEELTERLSILVDARDQANAAVARLLTRAEIAEKRLAMVRGNMLTATETIAKMQAEIDRFVEVTLDDSMEYAVLLDGEWVQVGRAEPLTLYRKAGEQ